MTEPTRLHRLTTDYRERKPEHRTPHHRMIGGAGLSTAGHGKFCAAAKCENKPKPQKGRTLWQCGHQSQHEGARPICCQPPRHCVRMPACRSALGSDCSPTPATVGRLHFAGARAVPVVRTNRRSERSFQESGADAGRDGARLFLIAGSGSCSRRAANLWLLTSTNLLKQIAFGLCPKLEKTRIVRARGPRLNQS